MECRFCHCTDTRACPGGCHWVKPGYCSTCANRHLEELVDAVMTWIAPAKGKPIQNTLCGRPCTIIEEDESLTVLDHVGAIAFGFSPMGVYLAPQYDALEILPLFKKRAEAA